VTADEDSDTATLQTSAATAVALATRTMLLPEFENAEVTRLFGVRWHRTHFQIRTPYSRTFHIGTIPILIGPVKTRMEY
jgi:hypothetical protein